MPEVKRFLVFAFDEYYPGGGWNDFQGSFDTIEEAREFVSKKLTDYDLYQILDIETGKIVEAGTPLPTRKRIKPLLPSPIKLGESYVKRMPTKPPSPGVLASKKGESSDVFIYALPLVFLGIIALKRIIG